MNHTRLVLLGVVIWLTSSLLIMSVAGQEGSTLEQSIGEAQDRTEDVKKLVETSQRSLQQIGSGIALGLGIGLILGSGVAYHVWRGRLS